MTTNDHILGAVRSACLDFSLDALAHIDPRLGARLAGGWHFVVVRFAPSRARLVVQAPNGEAACVYQAEGHEFPIALGTAAAACLNGALERLSDTARERIAALVTNKIGGGLGLIIDAHSGAVHVTLDAGDVDPLVLATLQPEPETLH